MDTGVTAIYRPSAAATPSRLFNSPLKLRVDPSLVVFSAAFFDPDSAEASWVGIPVDLSSRDVPRVKAAYKSSKSKIHPDGTSPINEFSVLSLILKPKVQ
jgi:hypothetical protein